METIESVIRDSVGSGGSDSEGYMIQKEDNLIGNQVSRWNFKIFTFTENNARVSAEIFEDYSNKTPYNFYQLLIDEDIMTMMVSGANRQTAQLKKTSPSTIHDWYNTDIADIKRFLDILFWIGQFQCTEQYSSKSKFMRIQLTL